MINASFSQLVQLVLGAVLGVFVAFHIGHYQLPRWKENLLLLAFIAVYILVTQILLVVFKAG